MRVVVSDTGPLLHLLEAEAVTLLSLIGEVWIPEVVNAEMSRLDPHWSAQRPAWINVATLDAAYAGEAKAWHQSGVLDAGEAAAIALARQRHADWFLADDAAARLVATSQGIEVHGSLGVVLWAAAAGHLDHGEARSVLDRLVQSSLWVSPRILAEASSALDAMFQ